MRAVPDPKLPDINHSDWRGQLRWRLTNVITALRANAQDILTGHVIPVKTVSAAYAMSDYDRVILVNAASAPVTVTLPAAGAAFNGWGSKEIVVKKVDATANAVTAAASSGNIDGAASKATTTQYATMRFLSDGTNYWVS